MPVGPASERLRQENAGESQTGQGYRESPFLERRVARAKERKERRDGRWKNAGKRKWRWGLWGCEGLSGEELGVGKVKVRDEVY